MQEHFPSRWVSTIALIHQNEYGFKMSAILAKKYVLQANAILEIQKIRHDTKNTITSLRERVTEILEECVFFDEFHTEYERFRKTARPGNVTEKLTKKLLSLHVRWQLSFLHQMLAHHLRHLHVDICHTLLNNNSPVTENALIR